MSVADNILRVNNVRGAVSSLVDRLNTDKLVNQDYGTENTLFDTTAKRTYEQETGKKAIEYIPLDVAIRYTPETNVSITNNPTQLGVNVNDHTYNDPDVLVVHFGTSDVKGTLARMNGLIQTVNSVYDKIKNNETPSRLLLNLLFRAKEERTRFQVDDGLHTYTDMIIQSITYDKDKTTYRALVATITLKQIIFVNVLDNEDTKGLVRANVNTLANSSLSAQAKKVLDGIRLVV